MEQQTRSRKMNCTSEAAWSGEEVINSTGFTYLSINKIPAALAENEDDIGLFSSTYALGQAPGSKMSCPYQLRYSSIFSSYC